MSTEAYNELLNKKRVVFKSSGFTIDNSDIKPPGFDFQNDLIRYRIAKGRAAVFAETGLGKRYMQTESARIINRETGKPSLIIAPLSVALQAIDDARNLEGTEIKYIKSSDETLAPICITNYERIKNIDPNKFGDVELDESSILKAFNSKTRQLLTDIWKTTRFRGAWSATPSPNDVVEIGNHSWFLGVMTEAEMKATFFMNRANKKTGEKWQIKGWAEEDFYRWLASWGMALTKPSDLGYDDDGYILPKLNIIPHYIDTGYIPEGMLFNVGLSGLKQRNEVRRDTIEERCNYAADIVNQSNEQFIVWCYLNPEADLMKKLIPGSINIQGSDTPIQKATAFRDFKHGKFRVLITKPKIAAFGMNFQQSYNAVAVGLDDCYDETTEILTKNGWKTFDSVVYEDLIATVNPNTLALEYQNPTKIVWNKYSGKMISIKSQHRFDLLVTPNHRIMAKMPENRYMNPDSGKWKFIFAQEILDNYKRQKLQMLSAPTSFNGEHIDYVDIPRINIRGGKRNVVIDKIKSEDFFSFAGWFISEGYCRPIDSREGGRITISQTKEYRKEIIPLFHKMGFKKINSRTKDITAYSKQLASFLIDNFGDKSSAKRIPEWMKNAESKLLQILFDSLTKGDGCHCDGKLKFYRTTSKQLANDFQEICVKLGIRASIKHRERKNENHSDIYDVLISKEHTNPSIHSKPSEINYSGYIGCVSVPNTTVIVRRNGMVIVSGNSMETMYQMIRRQWRYLQNNDVNFHIVMANAQRCIFDNVKRKEKMMKRMQRMLIKNSAQYAIEELQHLDETYDFKYNPSVPFALPLFMR